MPPKPDELGRGLFSHVVVDPADAACAVKILDIGDQRPPHDWRAEIESIKKVQGHPNIVVLLKTEEVSDPSHAIHLIMPRYALTLEQVIARESKAAWPPQSPWRNCMSPEMVRFIWTGLASALQAVHAAGIIHRDVKFENIMFPLDGAGSTAKDKYGSPVLIDFGIAWIDGLSEPASEKYTDVATAEYRAPELLLGKRNYDEAIDNWAMGCVAGRLLDNHSQPVFGPYTSDIGLISAQFDTLGRPGRSDTPSYEGTAMEAMTLDVSSPKRAFPLNRLPNNELMQQMAALVGELLVFEPTKRFTASQVCDALNSMSA